MNIKRNSAVFIHFFDQNSVIFTKMDNCSDTDFIGKDWGGGELFDLSFLDRIYAKNINIWTFFVEKKAF